MSRLLLVAAATAWLVACGGGGGADGTAPATPPVTPQRYELPVGRTGLPAVATQANDAGVQVLAITRLSETAVSDQVVEAEFRVLLQGGSRSLQQVRLNLAAVGAGTNVIDGEVRAEALSPGRQLSADDTVRVRHDRRQPFAVQDWRWTVTAQPLPTAREATLDAVGVEALAVGGGSNLVVLAGGQAQLPIDLTPSAGVARADLHLALAASAVPATLDAAATRLTVDAAGAAPGSTLALTLIVSHSARGLQAQVPVTLQVLAPTDNQRVTLSASTATVATPAGPLGLRASALGAPATATVLTGRTSDGTLTLSVRTDRAVEGEGLVIDLPRPADAPDGATVAQQDGIGGRKQALAAGGDPCTVVRDGSWTTVGTANASDTRLGATLRTREAWFDWNRRITSDQIVVDGGAASVALADGSISLQLRTASVLEGAVNWSAACTAGNALTLLRGVDWTQYEPVLLVHGFVLGGGRGGGEGTWAAMPRLIAASTVAASGARLLPFEFRWKTDANFKAVAADLAQAVDLLQRASGKQVHLLAHSFGGVVVRSMLQQLVLPTTGDDPAVMERARSAVAGVTSLGTPYAGLLPTEGTVALSGSEPVALPRGRDLAGTVQGTSAIGLCRQISCHQMGEHTQAVADAGAVYGLATTAERASGHLAAQLHATRERLPAIPIHIGIGLTVRFGNFGDGDALISFGGQRFLGGRNDATAQSADLAAAQRVGSATVTEVVLGGAKSARPGQPAEQVLVTRRSGGYRHAVGSDDDPIFGEGLEAGVQADCADPALCSHAGYRLFMQAVGNVLNLNLARELQQQAAQPRTLVLNPDRLTGITPAQRSALQALAARLQPYVSGPRLRWASVPADLLADANLTLRDTFGDTTAVAAAQAAAQAELQRLDDFQTRLIASQNVWITLDAENLATLSEIVVNTTKGAFAAAQFAQIAAPLNSSTVFRGIATVDPIKLETWTRVLRKLSERAEMVEWLGECGTSALDALSLATAAHAGTGRVDMAAVAPPLLELAKCIVHATSSDTTPKRAWLTAMGKVATGALDMNDDGRADGPDDLGLLEGLTGVLSGLLDFLKPVPVFANIQGLIDVLNAGAANYRAGLALASHTGEVVALRDTEAQALIDQLRVVVLQRRAALIAAARSADLFLYAQHPDELGRLLGTGAVQPSQIQWSVSSWQFEQLAANIVQVAWDFGTQAEAVVRRVVDGLSEVASAWWQAAGGGQLVAVLRDAAGAVQAAMALALDVQAAARPTVETVTAAPVRPGELVTIRVTGSALPERLSVTVDGCGAVAESAGGSSTLRQYQCTMARTAAAGLQQGAIGPVGSGGSPFAAVLKAFQVEVQVPVLPQLNGPLALTPAQPRVGDTLTITAPGEHLLQAGWRLRIEGVPGCDAAAAVPAASTDTELRHSCVVTAPTSPSGTVAVLDADGQPMQGATLTVQVVCPAGTAWDTGAARCATAPPAVDLTQDLIGLWRFDDCSGANAVDASRPAQVVGTTCVAGHGGQALAFDNPGYNVGGGGNWVELPSFTGEAVSISAWVRWAGDATGGFEYAGAIWSLGVHTQAPFLSIWVNEGTGKIWTDWFTDSTYRLVPGTWTMLTLTFDGGTATLYVDGVPVRSNTFPQRFAFNAARQFLSRHFWAGGSNAARLRGQIDDVHVHARALSADEVRALYQQTRTP